MDLGRPQLLGTGGHFSQGTLETKDVNWDSKTAGLTGRVRGNGGNPTTLFFHLPDGMKCGAATVAVTSAEPGIIAPSVLALDIPAAPGEPVTMELRFTGTPGKTATRPFAAGLVGEVKKTLKLITQSWRANSLPNEMVVAEKSAFECDRGDG